ncbi:N-acetyltransferase [Exiguobacterium sp. SH0S7]|uniref:GNAT family N-acetyltransferase n=1 Tax=Exiguobacterium sp. SH0S7 TaxID=2510951 RepID=UPI00103B763D|nr:GNAT family protein [Exiguobacterium sp. SH0S7]TCI69370.1 N-acetyltransferase [Exiguobacterium sp. SH0S7]
MIPTIETERLQLRQLQSTDAEQLHTIFSNVDVLRHYGMEPHQSLEQTEQMLFGMLEGIADGSIMRWGIMRKGHPELMGTIGFHNRAPRHRRAEIGYEIHPRYWRNGYATEALQAALTFAACSADIERVGAIVYPENIPSQQLLERNGFIREGTLRHYMRQGNQTYDVYVYGYIAKKDGPQC